ncbi:MAG: hypothetical protein KA492_15230 [Bacteroidia bacterium]|nr:hypothetical protein [Bacteroidia bacterium]
MIKIKTIRYDDTEDFQIDIRFDNSQCFSSLEIWGQSDMFKNFAKALTDFPFGQNKKIEFEWGEDDKKWAYYLLLTIEVYDSSGKIVLKTLVDNKGDATFHYRCEFPIITDVATINELGRQLLKWTPIENETWVFPADT